MLHLAAYTGLVGTTVNTDIAALTDDMLSIQNSHFQLRQKMDLLAVAVMSATLSRVRLDSPSIRLPCNPYVRPLIVGSIPPDNPNLMDLTGNPFTLPAGEEIAMQVTSAIAMGTEQFTGLIWLRDKIDPAPPGNVYTTRATSTTAAVANVWTSVSLTWETSFPAGVYAIVGSEVISTNAIAHRWIIPGQEFRPGGLSAAAAGRRTAPPMYFGGLGLWGKFTTLALPTLQVLVNGTDNAHTVHIELVRVPGL